MSNIIDNIGFIIIGIIAVYLFILIIVDLILKPQKEIKQLKQWRDDALSDYMNSEIRNLKLQAKIRELESVDYLKYKNQYCDDKNKQLEDYILKERFVDDLQKMKDKADDFANRLEMQSTERDSEEYQAKLKIVK